MNENGTKNLTKNNWYYFEKVIEINDIETDETTEDERDTKTKKKTIDVENETTLNENTIVNTVVELCDEVTTTVEAIEQLTTKKTAGNESGNENESQKEKGELEKTMYDEFNQIIERNTTKGGKKRKK